MADKYFHKEAKKSHIKRMWNSSGTFSGCPILLVPSKHDQTLWKDM